LKADFGDMVAAFRQEHGRLDKVQADGLAKLTDARKKIAAIAKASGTRPPVKAAIAVEPELVADSALHARLRDLLLGPIAPASPAKVVAVDPGSITDNFPAVADFEAQQSIRVPATLPLLDQGPARAIADLANVSDRARELLQAGATLPEYVKILLEAKLFRDVAALLAFGLAAREGVWWASLCVQHSRHTELGRLERPALRAAVAWVLDPTALCRQEALNAGQAAGTDHAGGCLALAAGQTPAPLAAARTEEFTPGNYVFRALLLASVPHKRVQAGQVPEFFIQLGLGVATGELTWKKLVAPKGKFGQRPPIPAPRVPSAAAANGHNLGKRLLVELGLVADPSQDEEEATSRDSDDDGFRWESSDTWNSLGM
jgi:hypothetical protein